MSDCLSDGSAGYSPPCPFFSADGEVDRVGRVRGVKIFQIRLVEHVLSGLETGIKSLIINDSRYKGSHRRNGNDVVDDSHGESVLQW